MVRSDILAGRVSALHSAVCTGLKRYSSWAASVRVYRARAAHLVEHLQNLHPAGAGWVWSWADHVQQQQQQPTAELDRRLLRRRPARDKGKHSRRATYTTLRLTYGFFSLESRLSCLLLTDCLSVCSGSSRSTRWRRKFVGNFSDWSSQ